MLSRGLAPPVAVVFALTLLASAQDDSSSASPPSPSPSSPAASASPSSEQLQCRCAPGALLDCSSLGLSLVSVRLNDCSPVVPTLDVSHNALTNLHDIPEWYTSELIASNNSISAVHSLDVKSSLEVLDVSFNVVETLNVATLDSLRVLNASHNTLEDVDIPYKCNLQSLDLSSNRLKELPTSLEECVQLDTFNASDNAIESLTENFFQNLLTKNRSNEKVISMDLRGNPLSPEEPSFLWLLRDSNISVSTEDCACANVSRDRHVLTLCVTAMCIDGNEIWTSAHNYTTIATTVVNIIELSSNTDNPSDAKTETDVHVTSVLPNSISEPTRPPKFRGKGLDVIEPPRPPPGPEVPSTTLPPPSEPGRDARRKRRLWVTLGLTAVVLLAAAGGVAVLCALYRRRQRQLKEERTQQIEMTPLKVAPLSLRAMDDDFVP